MTGVIDEEAYLGLLDHLGGDPAALNRFVDDFVGLWETRSIKLLALLEVKDYAAADIVLLSIRSSSEMVGAVVLEAIAALIHSGLDRNDPEDIERHLDRFLEVGRITCIELGERQQELQS